MAEKHISQEACEWREVGGLETNCSAGDFLSGVDVWITRPQVVNRRLLGAVTVGGSGPRQEGGAGQLPRGAGGSLEEGEDDVVVRELLPRARSMEPRKEVVTTRYNQFQTSVTFDPEREDGTVRGSGSYMFQYCRGNPNRVTVSIYSPVECQIHTTQTYSFRSREECASGTTGVRKDSGGKLSSGVTLPGPNGVTTPTKEWLYSVLLPKVVQWAEESGAEVVARQQPLVDLGKYCSLYRQLKDKYGPPLVQDWPEATDPHKFVYEDIAIATYLILLWEEEREELELTEKQSFIDLGCGNGLLVYLLSCEGYCGKGIDLRARKVWRLFGCRADLEVRTLTPSDVTVFPEYDWLIGNHSDELTPWIPLMAARSSYHTRYFVLPCCPHDFDSKFCRTDTTKSQYRSYLDYVRRIGETVGFHVQEDTMRIPSSKRLYNYFQEMAVCHVGRKRWYSPNEEREVEAGRRRFLRERCRQNRGRETAGQTKRVNVEERKCGLERVNVEEQKCGVERVNVEKCGMERVINTEHDEGGDMVTEYEKKKCVCAVVDSLEVKETASEKREKIALCKPVPNVEIQDQSPTERSEESAGLTEAPGAPGAGGRGGAWAASFVPRSSTEQTRNCAHVDRSLQQFIVKTLTDVLLKTENWVEVACETTSSGLSNSPSTAAASRTFTDSSSDACSSSNNKTGDSSAQWDYSECCSGSGSGDASRLSEWEKVGGGRGEREKEGEHRGERHTAIRWNLGGRMTVSEAVSLFETNVLRQLKQECGGLQTLLRNQHQVFRVNGGYVQLRNWADESSQHGPRKTAKPRSVRDAQRLVKTKLCWFHQYHPQGCPRPVSNCPYAHGLAERRARPDFDAVCTASFHT